VGWRAVGLSRLAHDPRRGVIKHDRPVMTGGQGGPYR
jgi:hypothetical protein